MTVLDVTPDECPDPDCVNWRRIGKKAAGRMLDGRTWDQMPQGDPQ